jgi:hypothetical protein
MVFNSSNPGQGASIDFATNATRFVRFSTSNDESQQIAGTTGSGNNLYNSGRITQANIVCPSTDFIYTMVPCPNQSVTSNFTASSPNQLTIGATYEVTGSGFTNIIATVQQETVGTPQATIVGAEDCPSPTLAAVELVANVSTGQSPPWRIANTSPNLYSNYTGPVNQVIWIDASHPSLGLYNGYLRIKNEPGFPSFEMYPCIESKISTQSIVSSCSTYPQLDGSNFPGVWYDRPIVRLNSLQDVKGHRSYVINQLNFPSSSNIGYFGRNVINGNQNYGSSFYIDFDFSGVTGRTSSSDIILPSNAGQCWQYNADSAQSPNDVKCIMPTTNSRMYTTITSGYSGSSNPYKLQIEYARDSHNLGCVWGNLITFQVQNGKNWTTAPTFQILDPSNIAVDPLNNEPLMEILPTSQPNALRLNMSAGLWLNAENDGGYTYKIIIKVFGAIS